MKTITLIIVLCSLPTIILIASCSNSAENVEKAEQDVIEANKDLDDANEAYLADMRDYKKISEEKISENQKIIEDFNKRIAAEKEEAKADYEKKIAELEAKNSDMKMRMEVYQAEGKKNWEIFKVEFSRELEEIDQGLKDLTGSKPNKSN